MNVIETALAGVRILEPQVFGDTRGWFMESWSKKKMEDAGICVDFVQDNHSFSAQKGTLRTALSTESNGTGKAIACLARCDL